MYGVIDKRRPIREYYLGHLLRLGEVDRDEADRIAMERRGLERISPRREVMPIFRYERSRQGYGLGTMEGSAEMPKRSAQESNGADLLR